MARELSIKKDLYDKILFNSATIPPSKNEEQLDISIRLRRKLKAIATQEEIKEEGTSYLISKMNANQATIILEEDEFNLLRERVLFMLPSLSSRLDEEIKESLDLLDPKTARKIEAKRSEQ